MFIVGKRMVLVILILVGLGYYTSEAFRKAQNTVRLYHQIQEN